MTHACMSDVKVCLRMQVAREGGFSKKTHQEDFERVGDFPREQVVQVREVLADCVCVYACRRGRKKEWAQGMEGQSMGGATEIERGGRREGRQQTHS